MAYELVLIPMDYTKHLNHDESHCVMCGQKLAVIDEFMNVPSMPDLDTNFEGLFSICEECTTPHLELLSEVDFKGPVLIGWE